MYIDGVGGYIQLRQAERSAIDDLLEVAVNFENGLIKFANDSEERAAALTRILALLKNSESKYDALVLELAPD